MIDGAQATPHLKPDVQALDCDFYCFSAHKMCGPTGVGILYGKESWLEKLPPYQGGGEMIREVSFEKSTYADLPHKFEAGTPNIADGIAFGTAIDYLNGIGFENIMSYENQLLDYGTQKLLEIEGLKIWGTSPQKASVISFNIGDLHPYDVGTIVDRQGIAVRTGHHCAQPIMTLDKPQKQAISDADWKALVDAFSKIKPERLPELVPPTEKRFYDGAAIAKLKITHNKMAYETTDFDHGEPPAEIRELVNRVLALVKEE